MSGTNRKAGDIFLELEPLLLELIDQGFQWGDILFNIYGYLMIHAPGAQEEYTDSTSPEFYYGPKRTNLKQAKKRKAKG